MKKAMTLVLIAASLSGRAQLFSPESFDGAVAGSLIGGIVGANHRHGFSGNGAAIGAGVGFVLGSIAGETRRQEYYSQPYVYAPATATFGYGYTYPCASPYVY